MMPIKVPTTYPNDTRTQERNNDMNKAVPCHIAMVVDVQATAFLFFA
jgi:hypothetical protein